MEEAEHKLWQFFKDEHGLILTAGQLDDIVQAVNVFNDKVNQPKRAKSDSKMEDNNTYRTQLGNIGVIVNSNVFDGEIGDTNITLTEGGLLCCVSGKDREKFIKEMSDLIAKYEI